MLRDSLLFVLVLLQDILISVHSSRVHLLRMMIENVSLSGDGDI